MCEDQRTMEKGEQTPNTELERKMHRNEPVVYNWQDITDDFRTACEGLNVGELVQVEYFLLFEAMTAIELMDPKMDVGMLCNRKKKILNLEQSIEAGKVKVTDFTMEEKIGIIDETFACLATWLEGHSLAQTVFTNLYLHNPSLINDRPMKTFCFTILKIVDFIKQLISNNASVIDEEVFQSMYGFQDNILTNSKVSTMLKDLEDEAARKCKSNSNNHNSAFHSRIKFTRALYQYLLLVNKQSTDNVLQTADLNKKIEICESTLDHWRSTLELGIQASFEEFNNNTDQQSSNDYPTTMGFSQFVNQRTLPPTFPRYTKIKSRSDSLDNFRGLISRFKKIQDANNCKTFRELFLFCNKLSENNGFHSCICSRSILNVMNNFQPMYHVYNGNFNLIFKDDIWHFVKPFFLQNKAFFAIGRAKDYLDFFLEQCQKPLSKLLRTTCLNRARQREKLESALYDLSSLVSNADKLDAYFNVHAKNMDIDLAHADISYFNCWSSYYLIRSMIQYLLFGFELELYSEHEFFYIYWYLQENLLSWLVPTLVRARNLYSQFETFDGLLANGPKAKAKNASRQIKKQSNNKHDQNSFHLHEIIKYNGIQFLIGALFKVCIVLMNKEVIKQPTIIAENLHILYFRRLSSFMGISSPPYVNYSKFNEVYKRENEQAINGTQDYIRKACSQLEEAKTFFEYIQNPDDEIESYLKVVKTNIVVLKLVLSGHKQIENLRLDFNVNKHYPTMKMI